jgi:hypothetical protein
MFLKWYVPERYAVFDSGLEKRKHGHWVKIRSCVIVITRCVVKYLKCSYGCLGFATPLRVKKVKFWKVALVSVRMFNRPFISRCLCACTGLRILLPSSVPSSCIPHIIYICVCVCARARVCACARACLRPPVFSYSVCTWPTFSYTINCNVPFISSGRRRESLCGAIATSFNKCAKYHWKNVAVAVSLASRPSDAGIGVCCVTSVRSYATTPETVSGTKVCLPGLFECFHQWLVYFAWNLTFTMMMEIATLPECCTTLKILRGLYLKAAVLLWGRSPAQAQHTPFSFKPCMHSKRMAETGKQCLIAVTRNLCATSW